ncbi:MAG TPA: hypothetical protein PK644_02265 [bacterium]|nr:hypothetical protein [bacterium]
MEQGASPVPITPYGRRPALILKQVRLRLQQLKREKEKVMAEREKLLQWREKVLVLSDWYRSRLLVEESFRLVGTSRLVHGFSGWVPRTSLRQFQQLLDKYAPDHCLVTRPALPEENPPVKLENPPLVRPFEVVTDLYGRPVYGTLDPSGPLSFFFALSFAYCLTDAAYGIILAGLSLWLTHRFRYQLQLRKFFQLMIISGLATVILGTLTGGWCGDLLSRLPPGWSVRESLQRLVLLNPLGGNREAFLFLGLAIVLGYLQILWGLFLNLWGQRRNLPGMLEPGLLFLIQLLLPIIGLSGLTGPGNRTVFITSLASFGFCLLMLTIIKAAEQKEVMLKLFWAFYAPYNVLAGNLLGDPLSYCRLFGLGLTTSVLGLAINEMVSLAREVPVIGFVLAGLLFLFGHLGNLAINLLGAYVHSSRLQYLEFFGKFFQAGGRSFQPLSEVREHTILREASS